MLKVNFLDNNQILIVSLNQKYSAQVTMSKILINNGLKAPISNGSSSMLILI